MEPSAARTAFTELLSAPIGVSSDRFWSAIEVLLFNPRITSKNVAGIVFDWSPLQVSKVPNLDTEEFLTPITDITAFHKTMKCSPHFQKEVTADELREKFHSPSGEIYLWIVKILYRNTKYRSYSYKCYVLGNTQMSLS